MIKITDKTVEGVTRGDPSGQPLSWNLIHWINSREEIAPYCNPNGRERPIAKFFVQRSGANSDIVPI
jgi:hypothetical protein